jgi:LPS-assembly lipoprotein
MIALRSSTLRAGAMLMLALALTACGFHLRGSSQYHMPFQSVYLGFPDTSQLGIELKRYLRADNSVVVVTDPTKAEAQFDVLGESRAKAILSLNSQGRVREYLLTYTLVFRVRDAKGAEMLGRTEVTQKRSITFNEFQALATEYEEALLYRDMQSDLVQQILRRLAAINKTA